MPCRWIGSNRFLNRVRRFESFRGRLRKTVQGRDLSCEQIEPGGAMSVKVRRPCSGGRRRGLEVRLEGRSTSSRRLRPGTPRTESVGDLQGPQKLRRILVLIEVATTLQSGGHEVWVRVVGESAALVQQQEVGRLRLYGKVRVLVVEHALGQGRCRISECNPRRLTTRKRQQVGVQASLCQVACLSGSQTVMDHPDESADLEEFLPTRTGIALATASG